MRARESTRFPCVGSHVIVNWAWGRLGSPSTRTPGPHGPTRMDNRGLGRITAPAPDPRGIVAASLACCFRIELSRWRVDPGPQVREGTGCSRLRYFAHAAVESLSMVLGRRGVQPTPPAGRPPCPLFPMPCVSAAEQLVTTNDDTRKSLALASPHAFGPSSPVGLFLAFSIFLNTNIYQ